MDVQKLFITLSVVGVFEAFYHAWMERAFTTNLFMVEFAPYASFFGVPYWLLGVVWFPVVLVVGLWTTKLGRADLKKGLLALLTVGNVFTVYLWYLDFFVVGSFTAAYVGLYVTNYALTGLVVCQNWADSATRDFAHGTIVGIIFGVFFGPFGVAVLGIAGGIIGVASRYTK